MNMIVITQSCNRSHWDSRSLPDGHGSNLSLRPQFSQPRFSGLSPPALNPFQISWQIHNRTNLSFWSVLTRPSLANIMSNHAKTSKRVVLKSPAITFGLNIFASKTNQSRISWNSTLGLEKHSFYIRANMSSIFAHINPFVGCRIPASMAWSPYVHKAATSLESATHILLLRFLQGSFIVATFTSDS